MRIEVTQDDIVHGFAGDCRTCPVALALARAFGIKNGVDGAVIVRYGYLYAWKTGDPYKGPYDLPPEVEAFLAAFDLGEPVGPFAFELPDRVDPEAALPDLTTGNELKAGPNAL